MRAKGICFLGLASFVKENFGQEALESLLEDLVDDPKLFLNSLEPFRWYPSELLNQVFEVASKELGGGDPVFAREIGAEIARLHREYKPDYFIRITESSLEATLNRFWLIYYDEGHIALIEDGKDFILRIVCPERFSRSYMEAIAGWIESLMVFLGIRDYVLLTTDEPADLVMVNTGHKKSYENSK